MVPFIIGIGGSYSGVGKTTLSAAILKHFKKLRSELTPSACSLVNKKWGAIKYTKTAFFTSIVYDELIIGQQNKDTKRLLDAGAEKVLWVQSPREELKEVLPLAIERLSYLDCIIVEGNSAIEFLKPDIVIFIKGLNKTIKPSAERILPLSDVVIDEDSLKGFIKNIDSLVKMIEERYKEKKIEEELKISAGQNTITCSDARKIAERLGVSYKEVGKSANDLKIKIKNCELGCF
jgi:LAO/AO transport system kinase